MSEEIEDKVSYREAFKYRRCLLPASEFQEQAGGKQTLFHLPDSRTFMIAGIWEKWRGGGDEVVESCAMLTTEANAEVRAIGQDRMPVVFTTAEQCAAWFDYSSIYFDRQQELCRPLPDRLLASYPAE